MRRTTMVLAVVVSTAPAAAKDLEPEIRAYCARQWAANFTMQKACVEQQIESAARWNALSDEYREHDDLGPALVECEKAWITGSMGPNLYMAVACFEQQIEAYRALRALNPSR